MRHHHDGPVNDLLDTRALRERYDDAAEETGERATGNGGLVLIGLGLVALLLWALQAEAGDCPPSAAAAWLEAQGYTQVELESQGDGWWRSWWLTPGGAVRVVAMQPLDDGSGCFAWHLLPQDSYTIEDLIVANEGW